MFPPFLNALEAYFRNKITSKIVRGKVDVFIRIKEYESDSEVYADTNMAKGYFEAIQKVSEACGYDKNNIPLSLILSQPGVLNSNKNYNPEDYKKMIEPVFDAAIEAFCADRQREGLNMKKDLESKLEKLAVCADFFKDFQPKMEESFKEQIKARFAEILGDNNFVIDENIIVELKAVKYVIDEYRKQLKNYLNLTHLPYGMLINFSPDRIYSEWYERFPNGTIERVTLYK